MATQITDATTTTGAPRLGKSTPPTTAIAKTVGITTASLAFQDTPDRHSVIPTSRQRWSHLLTRMAKEMIGVAKS